MTEAPAGTHPVDGIVSTRSPLSVGGGYAGKADGRGDELHLSLRADCANCAALCCVAPGFSASADFAIDKAPGQPCPHLDAGFRCSIHAQLRPRGFPGCAAYDCFGAGQHVTQGTFGGSDWRQNPRIAAGMFAAFAVMRPLHELLWYVTEALALEAAGPVHGDLAGASREIHRLIQGGPGDLAGLDVGALRQRVIPWLRRASELVRGDISPERDLAGADLIGQHLRGRDLRRASLRGAHLVGTDLTGADLRGADLTGADLRGADLRGADLTAALFLHQSQLDAARGDTSTRLARPLQVPSHWPSHGPVHGRSEEDHSGSTRRPAS